MIISDLMLLLSPNQDIVIYDNITHKCKYRGFPCYIPTELQNEEVLEIHHSVHFIRITI